MSELDSYVISIRFAQRARRRGSLEILPPPFAILFQGAQQIEVIGWFARALFIDVVVEVEKSPLPVLKGYFSRDNRVPGVTRRYRDLGQNSDRSSA